jgi:TonB family protein
MKTFLIFFLVCLTGFMIAAAQESKPASTGADQPASTSDDQKVYRVTSDVTPPRLIYKVDPKFAEQSSKAPPEGTVVLSLIVNKDGTVRKLRVLRSVRADLDEKAVSAVSSWRFQPATKEGKAVAVVINIEVNFKHY